MKNILLILSNAVLNRNYFIDDVVLEKMKICLQCLFDNALSSK